jgi:hypothetical protein
VRGMFAAMLVATAAGCGVQLPAPAPDSVTPAYGYNGGETIIEIRGKHFYPQVEVDASGRGAADVDDGFRVSLVRDDVAEPIELTNVDLVDYHTIRAIVPDQIAVTGFWDLVVTSPTGSSGSIAGGFEVTDTLADHLSITQEGAPSQKYGEPATVTIQLLDPENVKVFDDLEIEVEVVPDDPERFQVEFEDVLGGQMPLDDGRFGIAGTLVDGEAQLYVISAAPNNVWVTVRPADGRSSIAEDDLRLGWTPGEPYAVEITRTGYDEDEVLEAVAGEKIPIVVRVVDVDGHTSDFVHDIDLFDGCNFTRLTKVRVAGPTFAEVAFKKAAGEDCPVNRIDGDGDGAVGESGPIRISPAALHHFDVDLLGPSEIVLPAGEPLLLEILPEDEFGNPQSYVGAPFEIDDTMGGSFTKDCPPFGERYICSVEPTVAGEDLRIEVRGDLGVTGASTETFTVIAGNPDAIDVDVAATEVKAGVPVTVTVTTSDAWGNVVGTAAVPPSSYLFADTSGPVSCSYAGESPTGAAEFDCLFTTAAKVRASVSLPTWSLLASSDEFTVLNGDLAVVEVTPSAYTIGAGAMLRVTFEGFDAWGNPFEEKTNPILAISDTSGTIGPLTINLGGTGTGSGDFSFTKAGPTAIVASQGTTEYGRSSAVTVTAGAPSGLEVTADEPWVWTGEPATFSITAVDAFGNAASLDAVATVRALSGDAGDATATLVAGSGTATLTWSEPVADESVQASTTALSDSSEPFAVVEDCGSSGPTADLSFAGADEAIVCYDEISKAPVPIDLSGSSSSAIDFRVALGGAEVVTSSASAFTVTSEETGRLDVRAVVIDASGCGDEVEGTAWIGPDDGSAVGPLSLSAAASSIDIGTGSTTIDVEDATTCTGDPASGATVRVWSDRGEITGATSSGSGLLVTLDATGSGSFTLDATGVTSGGEATVQAGAGDGQAWGSASLTLNDDFRKPTVWEQSPRGDTSGSVSEIVLTFSEALRSATVVKSNFTVTGPATATIASVSLDATESVVTLTLTNPIDADAGTWTVTALSSSAAALTDANGNKLDGTYSNSTSTYVGTFGDVASAADEVTSCTVSRSRFRPDGDDGAGTETDDVELRFSSASTPVWWVLSVWSPEGELVRRDFVTPLASSDVWTWDGRDAGERVVDDGIWTIVVDSDDGSGNRGGSCATTVTVDNGSGG